MNLSLELFARTTAPFKVPSGLRRFYLFFRRPILSGLLYFPDVIWSFLCFCFSLVSENRTLVSEISLSEWVNKPGIIQVPGNFDNFLRGLISQPQNQQDMFFNSEVMICAVDGVNDE